jgi:hypothetical protein
VCRISSDRPLTAARIIASNPILSLLLDQDVFVYARRIELSLTEQNDCTRALAWCGENRSRLNKIGSTFEFDLRLQEFLTLVKQGSPIKAIEYARKFLAPAAITTVPTPTKPTNAATEDGSGSQRNNSQGDESVEPTAAGGTSESVTMVADPARVRVLQEAMNLLVFFGFENDSNNKQEEEKMEKKDNSISSSTSQSKFPPSSPHPWHKYRVYWSTHRFNELLSEFRRTHLSIYGLPSKSTLEYVLNIGLGSIKTSSCTCNHTEKPLHGHMAEEEEKKLKKQMENASTQKQNEDDMDTDGNTSAVTPAVGAASSSSSSSSSSVDLDGIGSSVSVPSSACPACTYPLSCLARSLPIAARTHSRLICRLTGALMDDKNPPMALPNGFVYSRSALQNMAQNNQGKIICPRTKQTFALQQARIAYVL